MQVCSGAEGLQNTINNVNWACKGSRAAIPRSLLQHPCLCAALLLLAPFPNQTTMLEPPQAMQHTATVPSPPPPPSTPAQGPQCWRTPSPRVLMDSRAPGHCGLSAGAERAPNRRPSQASLLHTPILVCCAAAAVPPPPQTSMPDRAHASHATYGTVPSLAHHPRQIKAPSADARHYLVVVGVAVNAAELSSDAEEGAMPLDRPCNGPGRCSFPTLTIHPLLVGCIRIAAVLLLSPTAVLLLSQTAAPECQQHCSSCSSLKTVCCSGSCPCDSRCQTALLRCTLQLLLLLLLPLTATPWTAYSCWVAQHNPCSPQTPARATPSERATPSQQAWATLQPSTYRHPIALNPSIPSLGRATPLCGPFGPLRIAPSPPQPSPSPPSLAPSIRLPTPLPPSHLLQVSQRHLNDTTLQTLRGNL